MDIIPAGSTNRSILFAFERADLDVTDMKLGYIRYTEGDGTSFSNTLSPILSVLGSLNAAHADNSGIQVSTDTTGGGQYLFRVDVPDAAFAPGVDVVKLTLFDDNRNVVSTREFSLNVPSNVYEGFIWLNPNIGVVGTLFGFNGLRKRPCSVVADALAMADANNIKTIKLMGLNFYSAAGLNGYSFVVDVKNGNSVNKLGLSGGHTYENCVFNDMHVDFTPDSVIIGTNKYNRCIIDATNYLGGTYIDCLFPSNNVLTIIRSTHIANGRVGQIGVIERTNTFSFGGVFSTSLQIEDWAGSTIIIRDMTRGGDDCIIAGASIQKVIIDSSCVDGDVFVLGNMEVVNNGSNNVFIQRLFNSVADIVAIKAQTDKMTFNGNNYIRSALSNVETSGVDQITFNLGAYFNGILTLSAALGGHTTTTVNTNSSFLAGASNDSLVGSTLVVQHNVGGGLKYSARAITANTDTSITFTPALTAPPSNGQGFFIIPSAYSTIGATLLNQTEILSRIGTPSDLGSGNNLSNNVSDVNSNVSDNKSRINTNGTKSDTIISTGGAGPWSSAGASTVDANLVSIQGSALIDGESLTKMFELGLAMVNGRFKIDTPIVGQTTFYKRDNITVLTVIQTTTTERTRIS